MALNTYVSIPNMTSWTYDAQRNELHVVGSDGSLYDWSIDRQAFVSSRNIGGTPDTVDITPDGKYLLVGNSAQLQTSGPFAFTPTYEDEISRVNLTTGGVDQITFSPGFYELGISHIAIAADNTALVTTDFAGSGWTDFHTFDAEAATPTMSTVSGLSQVRQASWVLQSSDRQHVLIEENNISDGPLHIYDDATHSITASTDLYAIGSSGFQAGDGDYSAAKGYVVDVLYGAVYVFDSHLAPLANLSLYSQQTPIVGAVFDADGSHLYLWEGEVGTILVLDTTNWTPVGSITGVARGGDATYSNPGGHMEILDGGKLLALDLGSSVDLVDLTQTQTSAGGGAPGLVLTGADGTNLQGGSANDTITGGDVTNYLRGNDGDDIIHGGAAFDDINGNKGNDTIDGGSGGSDWLVGGQGSDSITAHATQNVLYGNLGNDTLQGGSGPDILRGGQGDDVLFAGSGNQFLSGDRGDDTVTAGSGNDTIHSSQDAGIDRILGYNAGHDVVQLDPGTTYTVSQVGADTVITMIGSPGTNEVILVGVQMSSLTGHWIFEG